MRPTSGSSSSMAEHRAHRFDACTWGPCPPSRSRSTSDASATIAAIGHHSFVSPYGMHWPLSTRAPCSHSAILPSSLASRDLPTPASPVTRTRCARLPGRGGRERGPEHGELAVAADERSLDPAVTVSRGRDGVQRPPGGDRLLATLDRDRAERLVAHAAQRGGVRRRPDDHLVRPGDLPAAGSRCSRRRPSRCSRRRPRNAPTSTSPVFTPMRRWTSIPFSVAHLREPFLHPQTRRAPLARRRPRARPARRRARPSASPMTLSTWPPNVVISVASRSKQRSTRFLMCSGSAVSERRREPDEIGEEHGRDPALVGAGDEAVPARGQKRASAGAVLPHDGHVMPSS